MPESTHARPSSTWLIAPQPRLKTVGLGILLAVSNTIVPFSFDMYTPAVPELPAQFATSIGIVNLTLVGFYLFLSLGILLLGPLSDKFGRKPVLVAGLIAYTAGGLLCMVAPSIWALIGARAVQGIGAGAVVVVSTALVKDSFSADARPKILSLLQILQVLGPICAPLLGGIILKFATWHATFLFLSVFGLICLVMATQLRETLPARERHSSTLGALRGLAVIGRKRGFMAYLSIVALFNLVFMAYISCASYIYMDGFGLDEMGYTGYFSAAATLTVIGPLVYLRLQHVMRQGLITFGLLAIGLVAGVLLIGVGPLSAPAFCGCFLLFALCESAIRPGSINLLLAQVDNDTGSASALINFLSNIFGVIGMFIIMAPWPSFITGLGILAIASMLIAFGLIALIARGKTFEVKGL